MISVNIIHDNITGFYNGKPFSVLFDEQRYELMKELEIKAAQATDMEALRALLSEFEGLTKADYKEVVEHAKGGQYLWVNRLTGQVFLAINGKVSREPLPQQMVNRIITSVEKKIDVMPLVKNWARFLRNPWYNHGKGVNYAAYINTTVVNEELKARFMEEQKLTEQRASDLATMYDVSFTQEGLLATYKVVREIGWKFVKDDQDADAVKKVGRFEFEVDEFTGLKKYKKPEFLEQRVFEPVLQRQSGDAFYSGDYSGHIVRVGKQVYHDTWDKVDCNDGHSCVPGLHVGGLRYIKGYQTEDSITLNVFIDPMHIGGIDRNGTGALRVLKYFPHSAMDIPTQNLYHSSEYAKLTDVEYSTMIEDAVTAHDYMTKEAAEKLEAKKILL